MESIASCPFLAPDQLSAGYAFSSPTSISLSSTPQQGYYGARASPGPRSRASLLDPEEPPWRQKSQPLASPRRAAPSLPEAKRLPPHHPWPKGLLHSPINSQYPSLCAARSLSKLRTAPANS